MELSRADDSKVLDVGNKRPPSFEDGGDAFGGQLLSQEAQIEDGKIRVAVDAEEIGDGEASFGSAESFDSALEPMADSSSDAFVSPKGSPVGSDFAFGVWSGMEVAQRGALMRLNELNSGVSSLDMAVVTNCNTVEDFRGEVGRIAERNGLSPNDATVRNILELLVPFMESSSVSANGNGGVDSSIQEARDRSNVEAPQSASAQVLSVLRAEEINFDGEKLSSPASVYDQSKATEVEEIEDAEVVCAHLQSNTTAEEAKGDAEVDDKADVKANDEKSCSHASTQSDVKEEKVDLVTELSEQESDFDKEIKKESEALMPAPLKLEALISTQQASEVHEPTEEDFVEVKENNSATLERKEHSTELEVPLEVEPKLEDQNQMSLEHLERKEEEAAHEVVAEAASTEPEGKSEVAELTAPDLDVVDRSEEIEGGLEAENVGVANEEVVKGSLETEHEAPLTVEAETACNNDNPVALETKDQTQESAFVSDPTYCESVDSHIKEAMENSDTVPLADFAPTASVHRASSSDTVPLEDLVSTTSVPLASSPETVPLADMISTTSVHLATSPGSGTQSETVDRWQEPTALAENLEPSFVKHEEGKTETIHNESAVPDIVNQKFELMSKPLDTVPLENVVKERPEELVEKDTEFEYQKKTREAGGLFELADAQPTVDGFPSEAVDMMSLEHVVKDTDFEHMSVCDTSVPLATQPTEDGFSTPESDSHEHSEFIERDSLVTEVKRDQKNLSLSGEKSDRDISTVVEPKEEYQNGSGFSSIHEEEKSSEPVQSVASNQPENQARVDPVKDSTVGAAIEDEADEDEHENYLEDNEIVEADEGDGSIEKSAALAALVQAVESSKRVSGPPSLGSAGPSLPARPVGLGRSTPSLEPAPRVSQQSNNNGVGASQPTVSAENTQSNGDANDGNAETREKLQAIRVKFLRLAQRLGQTSQNVVVAQVLYRLGLAEQLRGGRSTSRSSAFSFDRASAMAEEQELAAQEDLDFSCTIMLLGKTGVGKSATINSIFDEVKAPTNAFSFATKKVQEITGTVHGIKLRIIDTPGLLPSVADQRQNEKIMASVKRFIKRSSPDIVLYFDRLDMQSRDFGDLPLLRTITDTFGAAIWFNAIVVLTHASSAPPDGPNGVPVSYEMFVAQRSHVVQQTIRQAAGDTRLMNPVSLVENHPACRTNRAGERVLPNGQVWKPQLLLLSFASKILAEANSLLKLQENAPGKPFATRSRVPPLPFLLSSLLQSRAQLKMPEEQIGEDDESDEDVEDDESDDEADYDELPPFRRLSKEEIEELDKEQRQLYFEELEDREKLFQKKQWREELKRRKELKKRMEGAQSSDMPPPEEMYEEDSARSAAVPVALPDMALPPTFDSDNPTHRYRYLETASQWLVRPVLETHGWDHDSGYDGLNLEKMFVVGSKVPVSLSGQITKDKKEANITLESAASLRHGEGKVTLAGFDVQTVGKDLSYTLRSETRFSNFKRNKTIAGLALTMLGDTVATGLKLEDRLAIGKRLKLVMNGGAITGRGDVAYGGTLEITLRDKDYPISRTLSTLGFSVMKWHGDLATGANLQSQFVLGKTMMVARANLNNRGAGQISIKASSSEQLQMALIGLIPIIRALFGNRLFSSLHSN